MSIDAGPARTVVRREAAPPTRRAPDRTGLALLGLAGLTLLLRMPYLHAPLTSDEGGFLAVARGWHAGGGSLYGAHWVDRPPLLLLAYRLAVLLGGLEPLRWIGSLAAAATVLAVGGAAHRAAGPRAAAYAGVAACALLSSPLLGTTPANGELLAAPFLAAGVWAAVVALGPGDHDRARAALAVGACTAAAMLVKQNMVDVAVFAAVLALCVVRRGELGRRRLTGLAALAAGGWAGVAAAVLGVAGLLDTRPGDVLWAMYPFRLRAAAVMAYVPWSVRWTRIGHLAAAYASSLAPLLLVGLVLVLARRGSRALRPVGVATLATAAYGVASVLAGGSYWGHYLVELVVPTALAAGLLGAATRRSGRRAVIATVLVAALGWAGGLHVTVGAAGEQIGTSIRAVAAPHDSVVSLLGDGDVVWASGLRSPYPYLWSLPSRTLDPRLTTLRRVLAGPHAPSWVVVRGSGTRRYLAERTAGFPLRTRYHAVAKVCGRTVLLRDDLHRAVPPTPTTCRLPLATWPLDPKGTLR